MAFTKQQPKLRLLIVSVGSLVGQNILDSLEFPAFSRRHLVFVAGTNSLVMTANNFRCDECFLVPPTASPDYPERMSEVLREVRPDLVLCGRDADTAAMCRLMRADSSLPGKLPYGTLESVLTALDKWRTLLFCRKHGLPFADSFVMGRSGDLDALRAFTDKVGFPLIAKPVEGFRSTGVVFVRNWDETISVSEREGYMFQEFLGAPDALEDYFRSLDGPVPLFTEAPDVNPHNAFVAISSDGDISDVLVLYVHYNFGVSTLFRRVVHPELEGLTRSFAEALLSEGGYGPLQVQFRQDRQGQQKAFEMNLRTTGGTNAHLFMGHDELGFIVNDLLPEREFPVVNLPPADDLVVTKSPTAYTVEGAAAATLTEFGRWRADPRTEVD